MTTSTPPADQPTAARSTGDQATGAQPDTTPPGGRVQLALNVSDVAAASQRLTGQGLDTLAQDATTCCYAVQDKVWVHDPDGAPWEIYAVLADAPDSTSLLGDGQCCATGSTSGTDGSGTDAVVQTDASGVPVAAARTCC